MVTSKLWHIVLLFSLSALFSCEKSPFTRAQKKRYRQHNETAQDPPPLPPKDEEKDNPIKRDKGPEDSDRHERDAEFHDDSRDNHHIDNLPSLGSRRPLRPLDVPLAGGLGPGGPGGPALVPPPVDPFTGGPVVPLPPPPPPLDGPEDLPLVPFFVTPICGNKFLNTGEECEDQNRINGDGCSLECKKEFCGNGLIEVGEQCDNGLGRFTVQGPGCDQYCQFIICGDAYVTGKEECDDGNQEDCDGCSHDCKVEDPCALALTCDCDALSANAAAKSAP